jgi:hypothetical protein
MAADIAAELQNHTGGLTVLIGWLAGMLGIFVGVLATIVWKKICRMEDRQTDLREKVLPQLISKEDFNAGVAVLQEIGQVFVSRVETFMTACSEGKCFMAKMVQVYHNNQPGNASGEHSHGPKTGKI